MKKQLGPAQGHGHEMPPLRVDGKVVQKVHMNMGRLDHLQEEGTLDGLLRSGIKFSKRLAILDAHAKGAATEVSVRKIGPPLLLDRMRILHYVTPDKHLC